LEVIESIVNNSELRSKNFDAKIQNQQNSQANIHVSSINQGIRKNLSDSLKLATQVGSTSSITGQINNLMNNYIFNPNPGYFLHPYSILNVNPLYAVPAGSINYWNHLNSNDLFPGVKQVEKTAKEIEDNIEKINQVKDSEKGNKKVNKNADKIIKEEKEALEKVEDDIQGVSKRMEEAEDKIYELLENPEIKDQSTKSALNASLNKIKTNSQELGRLRDEIDHSLDAI
jgi:DNA repair exonuclease SbcCD ATPase subunit